MMEMNSRMSRLTELLRVKMVNTHTLAHSLTLTHTATIVSIEISPWCVKWRQNTVKLPNEHFPGNLLNVLWFFFSYFYFGFDRFVSLRFDSSHSCAAAIHFALAHTSTAHLFASLRTMKCVIRCGFTIYKFFFVKNAIQMVQMRLVCFDLHVTKLNNDTHDHRHRHHTRNSVEHWRRLNPGMK